MGRFRSEMKSFAVWSVFSTVFLDFQWPWSAAWNWRPRSLLEDVACLDRAGKAAESDVDSKVKVILPSVGQTGTSSMVAALLELGMRTYHIEEQLIFTRPAFIEDDRMNSTIWARHMSRCRVEAVTLEPVIDVWQAAWKASPDAKVIMTWRDFKSWRTSTHAGGWKDLRWHWFFSLLLASSARVLPWISLYDVLTGEIDEMLRAGRPFHGVGQANFLEMFGFYSFFRFIYGDPRSKLPFRGTHKIGPWRHTEEAYLAHMDEIMRLVPPERLLIFDVRKHGWNDLTRFLGFPDKPAGKLFPHPRSKNSFTNDAVWDHAAIEKQVGLVAIFLALHVINYTVMKRIFNLLKASWLYLKVQLRVKSAKSRM